MFKDGEVLRLDDVLEELFVRLPSLPEGHIAETTTDFYEEFSERAWVDPVEVVRQLLLLVKLFEDIEV